MSAGTVSASAATVTRAITAAAGDQPAPISDDANVPDVPNVIADSSPSASPAPRPRPPAAPLAALLATPLLAALLSSRVRTVLMARSSVITTL